MVLAGKFTALRLHTTAWCSTWTQSLTLNNAGIANFFPIGLYDPFYLHAIQARAPDTSAANLSSLEYTS
jgi:hypothetical protein